VFGFATRDAEVAAQWSSPIGSSPLLSVAQPDTSGSPGERGTFQGGVDSPLLIPSLDTGLFVRVPTPSLDVEGLDVQFSRLPYLVGDIASARATPIVQMGDNVLRFVRSSLSHSVDMDVADGRAPGRPQALFNSTLETMSPSMAQAIQGTVLVFTRRDTQVQAIEGFGRDARVLWNMTISDLEEPQVFTSQGSRYVTLVSCFKCANASLQEHQGSPCEDLLALPNDFFRPDCGH
jgi:hypothetical protein